MRFKLVLIIGLVASVFAATTAHAGTQPAKAALGQSCANPRVTSLTGSMLIKGKYTTTGTQGGVFDHHHVWVEADVSPYLGLGPSGMDLRAGINLEWPPALGPEWRTCWVKGVDTAGNHWTVPGTILNECPSLEPHNCNHNSIWRSFTSVDPGSFKVAVAKASAADGGTCEDPYVASIVTDFDGDRAAPTGADAYYVTLHDHETLLQRGTSSGSTVALPGSTQVYSWEAHHGATVCSFTIINHDGTTTTVPGSTGSYTEPLPPALTGSGFTQDPLVAYVTAAKRGRRISPNLNHNP